MGNCQAIDTAAMVMHHPSGRTERLYWPVTASEVMRMNPGHYVSIIIPSLPIDGAGRGEKDDGQNDKDREEARFTRVKLLHASETLITGHAYRLINSQEVMNVLRAKRCEKMRGGSSSHRGHSGNWQRIHHRRTQEY
ncbi:hypothetical protein SAY86_001720 [Trapa natans]|uniref:Uncharacterized protein n=1 Tax=Trapa natans TaxID=22666 RepID=A0AAN7LQG1_TRANT|nr:hypothetical protein SAY86_001720 [Trapa natans]